MRVHSAQDLIIATCESSGRAIGSMRQPTAENVIANPVSSLGAPALAFLAGYGVEAVFRMLDGLAD